MAVDAFFFDHFDTITMRAGDLQTNTLKCALVTSAYTPLSTHTAWANVSTFEVANGAGYTTGGVTITTVAVTNDKLDFDDPAWSALTKTFRYAVVYISGTIDGIVNPLLFYYLLNDTPADTVVTASDWSIVIDASDGAMTLARTDAT